MKLAEIFAEAPLLVINGKSYHLEYSIQSELELERMYGTSEKYNEVVKTAMDGMETIDIINFLYAGLLHTELLAAHIDKSRRPWKINREAAKDYLVGQLIRAQKPLYVLAITQAFVSSMVTPEQLEMMDVIAASSDEQKKTAVAADASDCTPEY